jgi:hypothetical protein
MKPAIQAAFFLLLISCTQPKESDDELIVKVKDKTLVRSELDANIPSGLPYSDSILAAEHYVRTWIVDVLMYNIAEKNIVDMARIDRMVENYRKSLIVYQYQEHLINENLLNPFTDEEIYEYYNSNREKFNLNNYPAQGVFLNCADSLPSDGSIPFKYIKSIVREMRANQQKNDFLKKVENDIYQRAIERGEIRFYTD